MDAQAGGLQDRAQIGDGRALAVGAGDMDHRRQLGFGMIEPLQQALHAIEAEIDPLRMQRDSRAISSPSGWRFGGRRVHACGRGRRRFRRRDDLRRVGDLRRRLRRGFERRRLGQQPAQPRQRRAQLVAMHHHVDHAVVVQIFGALETFRQFLADGLLDHARAGEADQRAGLGDLHVAEHGVGGGDAAGGRIGQHHDVGQLRLAQHLHADRGARHLHQRQNAFLHARAAGGREHDEGRFLLDRELEPAHDRLARGHAERAAHEIEILHRDDDGGAFELAVADLDRVVQPGLGARILDAVDIFALVAELQRIGGHLGQRDVVPGLVVEDRLQPRHRAHAHVVVRAGNDELVGLDVLVEHELPGIRALDPQILRRLAAQDVADLRPDDVGEPVHGSLRNAVNASTGYMAARANPASRR